MSPDSSQVPTVQCGAQNTGQLIQSPKNRMRSTLFFLPFEEESEAPRHKV